MIRILTLLFCFLAQPAFAQCAGTDLLSEMPAQERGALDANAESQPYPNGILWRATRVDQTIHLVGTMHFFDPRHMATFDKVRPWIDAATTVFLELGEGDEARMQAEIQSDPSLAFIIDGPTLPDLLAPQDWNNLKDAMAERGMPGFLVAKMKPWMALMTLSLTKCVVQDVQAGKRGLDQIIIDYATQIGNPAKALEPYDTALKLFEEYSQDEMLEFLSLYLRLDNVDPDDQHHTLVQAYFREEIRVIWEFGLAQSLADRQGLSPDRIRADFAQLEDILIARRNQAWMDRILGAANAGPVFLAAGALHMPGHQGLLRLLEAEGFQIERILSD